MRHRCSRCNGFDGGLHLLGGGVLPGADDGKRGRADAGRANRHATPGNATAADGAPHDGHATPRQAPHGSSTTGLPRRETTAFLCIRLLVPCGKDLLETPHEGL